jgi:phosphatidylglycerophosphate synthase
MSSRQRRRKKHRGTQAGTVRQRSRKSGSRSTGQLTAAERRRERLERPPSWRAATNRAMLSAAVFFALLVLLLGQPVGSALAIALFMVVVYIPMGYAIDSFIYRARQRRKQRKQAESAQ